MNVVESILVVAVLVAVPVLWGALGEALGETAGVLNVGVEGVMLFGAFASAYVAQKTGSPYLAAGSAIPAGLICGAVLAYFYVYRGTEQIVTGLLFNMVALGLTTALFGKALSGEGTLPSLPKLPIPLLDKIPLVGEALFELTLLGYLGIVAAVALFWVIGRTWFGLHLRALGERPAAGEAAGLDVLQLRAAALIAGCVLASIGGAAIDLTVAQSFIPNLTNGEGFIAIALVLIFRRNPLWLLLGAFLFGVATSLQFQLQVISALQKIPSEVLLALPYLATIIAVAFSTRARFPAAVGVPYRRIRRQSTTRLFGRWFASGQATPESEVPENA
jgi:general nucleoside transport system permease protein